MEVGWLSIPTDSLTSVQQGVPTVLLGVLCLFLLPGRPESTDFLTHAERKLAIERMNRGTSGDIGAIVNKSTPLASVPGTFNQLIYISGHVIAAFLDWRAGFSLSCTKCCC